MASSGNAMRSHTSASALSYAAVIAATLLLRSPTRVLSCAKAILIRVTQPAYRSLRSATRPTTGIARQGGPDRERIHHTVLSNQSRGRHRRKECRRGGVVEHQAIGSGRKLNGGERPVDHCR